MNNDIDLRCKQQAHLKGEYNRLRKSGCTRFDFMGGRRSGKTYFILQRLLGFIQKGYVVSVATMTDTQGRLGAYQDAKDIITQSPHLAAHCTIGIQPRVIQHASGGRMFFNSYKSSETAKGIACDYLYINEANNFTEQQYIDLAASVRRAVFADRNPNTECWTERNTFSLIHSTWKNNAENLTAQQLEWFADLKRKAESPNATGADIAFYRMYYLGEYAEIFGDIFTPSNIQREKVDVARLRNFAIIADPSNLTGADYFACVLVATDGARMYVVDVFSENTSDIPVNATDWALWCKRWEKVLDQWREWIPRYDVRVIFCEQNGVGNEFLRYAKGEDVANIKPFIASESKHKRILANYDNICSRVVFNEGERIDAFLSQVYEYAGKDKADAHDDNIDCVSTAFDIFYKQTRFMQ